VKHRQASASANAQNSVRKDVSLAFESDDLGTYLVSSLSSGFCYACYCYVFQNCGSQAQDPEIPTISGPQTVWWFNGATPSGYAVSITLSAWPTNCSSYSWTVSSGSDKANLSGQTANKTNVTGKALSTASGDVGVTVTAGWRRAQLCASACNISAAHAHPQTPFCARRPAIPDQPHLSPRHAS